MWRWAYRCHQEVVDRVRDSLARTWVPEKRKIITWPVTGVDLQTLYVDVPWLDTGIESLNSSDVPWRDTGIESGEYSRQQIHPGEIQESDLRTLQTCPGRIQESSLEFRKVGELSLLTGYFHGRVVFNDECL